MNFAEGKGPKQVKKSYPLGQFTTIYGNGSLSNVNPAPVAYPQTFSGGQVAGISGTSWGSVGYYQPGSVNPGLNLSSSINSNIDISVICSPGAQESIQDIETVTVTLNAETGWSGTATVWLQGTLNRYTPNAYLPVGTSSYSSTNWVSIASTTITGANLPALIKVPAASGILYNAYRLVASGGTGIIDWAIPGMFIDLSAMQVGQEAVWANGNLGQTNIQDNDVITISGGQVTNYTENPLPLENIQANHTWVQ